MDGVGVTYGENIQFDFWAHVGWFGISGAGICMKLRCGSNGIGPGVQKNEFINLIFIYFP